MDDTEFLAMAARFRSAFDRHAPQLSKESRAHVEHYVDVAELEMACESFVLSVLEERVRLPDDTRKALLDLALVLQLDRETVFRADFWQLAGPFLRGKDQ